MIAAIYARKSTNDSDKAPDARSNDRQIAHARLFISKNGWRVADECIYSDDGISGAEFDKRPGLARLLNALASRPPFQVLVVSEISRLGREQFQMGYVLGQVARSGVQLFEYLTGKEAQLTDATGKFMLAVGTFADEMERERARQRTFDALRRKAASGAVAGGRTYGYDNVRSDGKTTRVINEAEAAIIRRIFELVGHGMGLRAVAHKLNDDHIPAPRFSTRGWCGGTVRAIVRRSIYRGEIVWNKHAKRNSAGVKRSGIRKPEADWIRVPAPELRIISDETWQRVAAELTERKAIYLRTTEPVECKDGRLRRGLLQGHPRGGAEARQYVGRLGDLCRMRRWAPDPQAIHERETGHLL
jgi:site-specific DNA recombinase